jgi:hypothetical protein
LDPQQGVDRHGETRKRDVWISYWQAIALGGDVSSPEIGLHLFHPNARCTTSGLLANAGLAS